MSEKIGFIQQIPTEKLLAKDSWEQKFGNIVFFYSTEEVAESVYFHECKCKRGDSFAKFSTQTSGRRLTREEIERLPRLAKFVSSYLPEVA